MIEKVLGSAMTTLLEIPAQLSLEAFLAQPETKPASEYRHGYSWEKPMPQGEHSLLQASLTRSINQIAQPQKFALALPELRCTFGGRSLVPDIAVFSWERIPKTEQGKIANRFVIAPDWVIEILSPEQATSVVIEKMLFCLEQGTRLGWLIDPAEALVFVFLPNQQLQVYRDNLALPVLPEIAELNLTVAQLFQWLEL
jgi:Uma2 family endonuclease